MIKGGHLHASSWHMILEYCLELNRKKETKQVPRQIGNLLSYRSGVRNLSKYMKINLDRLNDHFNIIAKLNGFHKHPQNNGTN